MTAWAEWPASERVAGAPINETFCSKWAQRYGAHRNHAAPAVILNGSGGGLGSYVVLSTSEIWIPPWAAQLNTRFWMAINLADTEVSGEGRVLFRIGGVATPYARVLLAHKVFNPEEILPGADGLPGSSGTFYSKNCTWTAPANQLDTVQTITVEALRASSNVISVAVQTEQAFPLPRRRAAWSWRG